ncbi:MAG TPA: CHASE3 domain-containing protein [Stellaceae bacterium]|nr:CHASE3 domain-containing protein [Stellaceae bacterium]
MAKALVKHANILSLIAAILVVFIIGLLTWRQFANLRESEFWVDHTYRVIGTTKDLGIALRDAERTQRSFLLTGRIDYLTPYRDAVSRIPVLEDQLHTLTGDNPPQQERLATLDTLIRDRLEVIDRLVQVRRTSGLDSVIAMIGDDLGSKLMAQIGTSLDAVTAAEQGLLKQRQLSAEWEETATRCLALGGGTLAIFLLAFAARLLTRSHAQLLQSEGEQRNMAEQMSAAFESISQGIGVFGGDMTLDRWNTGFAELLGLPVSLTHYGTPYATIVEHVEATGHGAVLEHEDEVRHGRSALAPGEPVVYVRTRPNDGRTFEFHRTATPSEGFVLTITDITERVRAEAAAHDAQRLQAMGQLTGGIAHDFNNLLTVVLGNLEMAQAQLPEDSVATVRIERAIWGAQRGATLTQQLLAFARRQPLAPAPINLSAMLPEMASLLRRTLGEHIEVRVFDTAGPWPALADPTQVESALLNLALNSRDAMPGGGRLTIEVANKVLDRDYARQHAEVTAGDYVMLAVSDTGCGMTPEVMARAFDPFYTTKDLGKGTGLGLAMVFGFAKQSDGHVKIYSEPGEGTTVRLYLPRALGAALPAPQRSEKPVDLPHGSATVLVVEDEPAVREVTATILRDLGYRVLEASDGAEALRVFGQNDAKVDMLLLDVVLPGGMKGNEVARRLAEIRPNVRVLFMSGYTENAIVHHGRLDDGVQLIGKPFQREQLARKVAEVLGVVVYPVSSTYTDNVTPLRHG